MEERILKIRKTGNQYQYQIVTVTRTVLDWQYGTTNKEETLEQAVDRFGSYDTLEEE